MKRLSQWRGHAWLALPVRVYLGVVFLLACAHKLADPGSFAIDVATYQILPLGLVNLVAIVLPWMELAAGVMLIVGLRTRAAALLVSGMMAVFVAAILIALSKGLDMSCGCFASQAAAADDPISWLTVARDGTWLGMALYVLLFDARPLGLDRWLGPAAAVCLLLALPVRAAAQTPRRDRLPAAERAVAVAVTASEHSYDDRFVTAEDAEMSKARRRSTTGSARSRSALLGHLRRATSNAP